MLGKCSNARIGNSLQENVHLPTTGGKAAIPGLL
jgi:hypothetical protein